MQLVTVVLLLLSSPVRLTNLVGMAHRGSLAFLTTSIAHRVSDFANGWHMVTKATPVAQLVLFVGHDMYRRLASL